MTNNQILKSENDQILNEWREKEKCALNFIRTVGDLRFDKSIEIVLFRKDVYDIKPTQLIQFHKLSSNFGSILIEIEDTHTILNGLEKLDIQQLKIDIGQLALQYVAEKELFVSVDSFLKNHLNAHIQDHSPIYPKDVILYGFGRIGRLLARRIILQTGRGEQLRLKAIVIRPQMKDHKMDGEKRAALLISDSVHGDFGGSVSVSDSGNELTINGNKIQLIYAEQPEDINYIDYGIENAIVIDNTGVFRDKEALQRHLRPGVSHVLLTAPGKKIPNIVFGVNHESIDIENNKILCAASCTTNAIVPVIKVMDDSFGIQKGHVETIHSYTSDQNLLDNFHKKPRRGKAAALNMVITSTGAAEAISAVLPYLDGKITGNAVRVPTPNVSLAIINLTLTKATTLPEVQNILLQATMFGNLADQIQYSTSEEYVSTNAIGMTSACVIDGPSTILSNDGKTITIYAWYDNEFGYTCQVVRVAKYIGKVRRATIY